MFRFESQAAYILHTRPYRETSLILEVFTADFGRMAVIARGAKRPKSGGRGTLQPFVALLLAGAGRGELLTLNKFEPSGRHPLLVGRRLMSALYLNELLIKLLQLRDPYPELFQQYQQTLHQLECCSNEQETLRLFEKNLLKALGYELQLTMDVESGAAVEPDRYYFFEPQRGPTRIAEHEHSDLANDRDTAVSIPQSMNEIKQQLNSAIFKGSSLLALASGEWPEASLLQDAKRLMRLSLKSHLGHTFLETRRLFV